MIHGPTDNFESLGWFHEGFTEYFTGVLNHRLKIIDDDEFAAEIETHLKRYYESPVRNATNAEYTKQRWTNDEMMKLSYSQGFTLAYRWDRKIKEKTKGSYSLDDAMRDILNSAKAKNKTVSAEDIVNSVDFYLGGEAAQDFDSFIIKGKTIDPVCNKVMDLNGH